MCIQYSKTLIPGLFILVFNKNITHISKFKPGTVEKNSSTIGPPAGIEPTPLRCRCNALATELRR